ncbi:hypothetical protein D7Y05_09660 [bacterium 1XD42-54]|nr:hypothetical protein D7Y05_09660 [bacterium 1XD42-54]
MGDIGKLSGKESGHATMYSGKAYTPGTGNAPRRIVRMDTENGYDDQPERRVPRLRPEAEGKHRSDSETQRRHVREHTRGTNDSMERGHDTDTGRRRIARLVESQEQRERPRHSHEKRNDRQGHPQNTQEKRADRQGHQQNTQEKRADRQERSQYMQEKHESLKNLSQDSSEKKTDAKKLSRNGGVSSTGWKERAKQRRKKKLLIFFGSVGVILISAYIAVAVYFSGHFYEDTAVYGIDCSQKTVEEVKSEIEDKLDEYVLEIQERKDKTEQITASQIKLQYVDDGGIDRMMKAQRAYIWPIMLFLDRKPGEAVAFSYDREQAKNRLMGLDCMNPALIEAPQDAYITATDTGFEVVREVMGTTLDTEKTIDVVLQALDDGAVHVSLEEEACYVNPKLYQDDEKLQHDATGMSELARANITYTFGDQKEIVNAALIWDWIVELPDGSFVIDDGCVSDYVESLAAKYDTFGLPLEFYTTIGTTVTLSGGDYGWCINQSETVVDLLNALEEGYRGEKEPVYLYSAMSHENQGIGYTYVEICISLQEMWCYQDGNLVVDTAVVTGNPNKGNATPSGGVWAIDAKKRDAILTGEGYTSPVDYWMPFNGDVGIHDMQQRSAFGGSIYLSNGSHGCVNTPYDQVQMIYDVVSIGTPVIVYE